MLYWALTFLTIGLVAGLLGVSGVVGTTAYLSYVLVVIFIIVAMGSCIIGKRPRAIRNVASRSPEITQPTLRREVEMSMS